MAELIFVTGGSGFVGAAIIRAMVSAGHRVRALARSEESARTVSSLGAEPVRGDLDDERSLAAGMRGSTVVVHAAASLTSGVRYRDHERTNVEGTRRVLTCARQAKARRFIYVSAASIVIEPGRPTHGDETLPVVHHRSMPYSATKGLAERIVLEANGSEMSTIAVRPPFIWGEGAPSIGHIAHAFHEGRFMWIGGGEYAYSVCHVDNLASAVARAVDHGLGGKAYFVTDDDVTSMRQFFTDVIEATGQPAKARAVPYWFGALLARMMSLVFALFRPGKQPPLSLETVRLIGKRLELSNALAKRELGYVPQVSREVGVSRLRATASNKLVRHGSTHASVAAQTLVILALAATALMTTVRAFAAPPTEPTGMWQLYDDFADDSAPPRARGDVPPAGPPRQRSCRPL
ncbi:NAD-dependent epimerase/dehydratase family protein [Sorangium sp. So ce406]|uniref:NAD-dependent epimerase/dehydratase family protein n=1 Tax=Sorangium sp. So ce406 TaxID=3133311 RepID=UPI003F5BF586